MNIQITGKDLKATEAIKNYVEKKLARIEKYFDTEDMDVFVTIKAEREMQIAELSVSYKGERFRAVTEHKDLYASIDKDIDVLEGQIRKAKTKKEKQTKEDSIKLKEVLNGVGSEVETEGEIVKALYYEIKPISVEDAKLKLQEKPTNNFLTFINVDTNKVNVIFKLKDGKNFGLVEPEA